MFWKARLDIIQLFYDFIVILSAENLPKAGQSRRVAHRLFIDATYYLHLVPMWLVEHLVLAPLLGEQMRSPVLHRLSVKLL